MIRSDSDSPCPFGLPINFGCQMAGEIVKKMAPLDIMGDKSTPEDKEKIKQSNIRLMTWILMMKEEPPAQCVYAGLLFPEKKDKVECNYSDAAPGQNTKGVVLSSPQYSTLFAGVGLDALTTFPLSGMSDYNSSMKNTYYATYSIQGNNSSKELTKFAEETMADAEAEKAKYKEDHRK